MKFATFAAILGLDTKASASLLTQFSNFDTAQANSNASTFLLDETDLTNLVDDPPSLIYGANSSYALAADIVSLGSITRMDYLFGQLETWASHQAVRHFWGFSELQDYDPQCAAMPNKARATMVDTCKFSMALKDPKIQSFFSKYYGIVEGQRERSNDAGWICAQRRVGRAFGWLHSQYTGGKATVPEYLVIVDDDTSLDLVDVMAYLEREEKKAEGQAFARAGCVFPQNDVIPFPISYGGFGTILNKAAIQKLSKRIYCGKEMPEHQAICAQIKADTVGEAAVFQEGMTVFELFYKYSSRTNFCMHSDWLLGYILEYYLHQSISSPKQEEGGHTLMGMMNYPSCGNVTFTTGTVRRCTQYSYTCHNQEPRDMEAFAISSYAQSPESYKAIPKLKLTDIGVAMGIVKSREYVSVESAPLPNVFLLGAIDAGSSKVAEFLFSNGVCGPENLDDQLNNSIHFFNHEDSYKRGYGSYAKHFEHCSDSQLVMDTFTEILKHPELVYDMYHHLNPDSPSKLKLIVVLHDSNPGEYSIFLETWASVFDRQQLLVLSSSELQQYPQRSKWRMEQFLGQTFEGILEKVESDKSMLSYSVPMPKEILDSFYQFMDQPQHPWMEEHPFPRATAPKIFAYTSVLGWNPNSSQNALYLDAMRILIRSLKASVADFIVLMMYRDEEAELALHSEGAIVKHISPVKHSLEVSYFEPWFVDIALAKLRAFELTEYDRVQVVDADSVVMDAKKMDMLFTSYNKVKLVAEGLGSDSPLRAGWLLIEPSIHDFHAMQQLLERGIFTSELGWDNLDLPIQYPGWKIENPSNNWEFYGSQLEQGLLYHLFYALPKSVDPDVEDQGLLTLLDDETLLSLGFVHFYGDRKPWLKDIDVSSLHPMVALTRNRWLKDFQDLSSITDPGHLSPLTPIGIKQYRKAQALYSPTSSPTLPPVSLAPVSSGPIMPAPVSLAPIIPVTVSMAPITSIPVSSAPITPVPMSLAPITPLPVSSAPITPAPMFSSPISPPPMSLAPITTAPVTSIPLTPVPVSTAPITPTPLANPAPSASPHRTPSLSPHHTGSPTPKPTTARTADTCGSVGSCNINPDPHYMTWDNKWYDFQGGCDQYAIDNPVLEVQIRTRPRYWYSTITQIAIRIKATNEVFRVNIDGQYENTIGNSGVGPATHSADLDNYYSKHTIHLAGTAPASFITVHVYPSYGISMQAYGCNAYFSGSEGMCGSWDRGEAFLKDGSRFKITGNYEYDKTRSITLAKSWQVPTSKSLLWDPSTECDSSSSCGEGEVFSCEADPRRLQAHAGCNRSCSDITVQQFREQCEKDVELTGDQTWACAASYVTPVIALDRVIPSQVTVKGKWYVDWKREHCVQDCETSMAPSCGGYANKWDKLYADAAACCKSTLSYKNADWCEESSLGNLYVGTGRYYVDEKSWKCTRDCASDGPFDINGDCGEIISDGWVELYDTAQDCCKARMGWQNSDLCVSQLNPSKSGTNKFYVIYHDMKCAQDCPSTDGAPCAGPPDNLTEQLFDDASKCCKEKLPWVSLAKCLAATNGNVSGEASGTGHWYVDWKLNKCVKDCVGNAPCGGLKETWDEGYVNSNDCCNMISWVPANKCHD